MKNILLVSSYFLTSLYLWIWSSYVIVTNYQIYYIAYIPLAITITYFLSILFTGILHFVFDNYFSPNTPIIGVVVHEFREHHTDPGRIARRDTLQSIEHAVIPAIAINIMLLFINNPFIIQFLIGFGMFGILTNIVHRFNHLKNDEQSPKIIKFARKLKLIQSKEQHDIHHTAPHTTSFFILSDIFNPYFNRKDIWRKTTVAVKKITGVKAVDF